MFSQHIDDYSYFVTLFTDIGLNTYTGIVCTTGMLERKTAKISTSPRERFEPVPRCHMTVKIELYSCFYSKNYSKITKDKYYLSA